MTAQFYVGEQQKLEVSHGWQTLRALQAAELAEIARHNPKPTGPGQLSVVFQVGKLTVEQRQQQVAAATEDAYYDLSDLDDTSFAATTSHVFSSLETHQTPTMPEGNTTFDFSSSAEPYASRTPDKEAQPPQFSGK